MRIFQNPNNLPEDRILERLLLADAGASATLYKTVSPDNAEICHVGITSEVLTDLEIEAILAQPITSAEQAAAARKAESISQAKLATELRSLTPDQAVAYIENNVTSLASAKAVMKVMARLLIAMRDELWPGLPDA